MNRREFILYSTLFLPSLTGANPNNRHLHNVAESEIAPRFIPPPAPIKESRALSNPLRLPGTSGLLGLIELDAPINLRALATRAQIFAGAYTQVLAYAASSKGQAMLNPILRIRTGQDLNVTLSNELGEDTSIHWHGLHVDEVNDGSGFHPVKDKESKVYQFKVSNRPGLYWYHPHPHYRTGAQVHQGMGSLLLVEGPEDDWLREELGLRWGDNEIPLLLQDKQVDTRNKLKYSMGEDDWIGNRVLVNWTPEPFLNVRNQLYRLRILNGSNARVYLLGFRHGKRQLPFHIIGADGGLLPQTQLTSQAFLAPAQRLDVLVDFSRIDPGSDVVMSSLRYDPMENDGGPGIDPLVEHPGAHLMGEPFDIMKFAVAGSVCAPRKIPQRLLSERAPPMPKGNVVRRFRLHMNGRQWLINGRNHHSDMNRIEFTAKGGTTEIWEMRNDMRSMPHPMHLHGFHFKVLERRGSPRQVARQAINVSGVSGAETGWLDTVLVWPGEVVRILVDYRPAITGSHRYMFHCHNLEHEDQGLMLNFRVDA